MLLSSLSFTTIGRQENRSNIITVDDDGDGDYTCIQDAIDNASEETIIYVYSGDYETFVLRNWTKFQPISNITIKGINHELNQGNGSGKPRIVDNSIFHDDRLIYLLYAHDCVVDGFYLSSGGYGILLIDSWNNTISNNTIYSCDQGIELHHGGIADNNGCQNIIKNNTIYDCYRGIEVEFAYINIIIGNSVNNCDRGIYIYNGDGNVIRYNRLINNGDYDLWGYPYGEGILLLGDDNIIEFNQFKDNVYGLSMCSSGNTIRFNNFYDSKELHGYFDFISSFTWDSNYYDNWLGVGPKIIKGYFWVIPWFTLDWHPAREPFDIP